MAFLVATMLLGAVTLRAWGQQLQAACLPKHGVACVDDIVPNQLAFLLVAFAIALVVIAGAMWLYRIGVNGYLEDMKAQAGEPVQRRRK